MLSFEGISFTLTRDSGSAISCIGSWVGTPSEALSCYLQDRIDTEPPSYLAFQAHLGKVRSSSPLNSLED